MAEPKKTQPPIDLGIYSRNRKTRMSAADVVALALSGLWIVAVGGYLLLASGDEARPLDSLRFVMTLLAIFLPVAVIWVAATGARANRMMREESARLHGAIDALRLSYIQSQQIGERGVKPAVEKKLEEIAAAQRKTEDAIATFTSIRREREAAAGPPKPAMPQPGVPEEQGSLALTTPSETPARPVNVPDFIRALNFPENAEDQEGFRALRRALQDRQTAQLVQASQDVLTMLSQDGIYMDDLRPDRARPEIWRRFARGERGRAVSGLGGVRDRSALALAAGRMRKDQVFRDAVHHFLRRFDKTLAAFETHASDADLADLSDTRTARAFMLLGRVTGMFD